MLKYMHKLSFGSMVKRLYFRTTGYSYTNLGRLFLRLFVGSMLLQFGLRQLMNFDDAVTIMPEVGFMSSEITLIVMIAIELVCATFIMFGFLTRLMLLPPFIAMIIAEYYLLHDYTKHASYMLDWVEPGYLPIMFLGIFFFLLLVGPGKISVDYFLSLHLIHSDNQSESELEEV